jgi:hypothetical protein
MGSNHKKTGGNMNSKQFLLKTALILAIIFSIMILHTGMSSAKSMTLKVSHQFAAGDVRDQMGRVFGDGIIPPNLFSKQGNNGTPCAKVHWICRLSRWIMHRARFRSCPLR